MNSRISPLQFNEETMGGRLSKALYERAESGSPSTLTSTEFINAMVPAVESEIAMAIHNIADEIQAMHPGEKKASVEFLRDKASEYLDSNYVPKTFPGRSEWERDVLQFFLNDPPLYDGAELLDWLNHLCNSMIETRDKP